MTEGGDQGNALDLTFLAKASIMISTRRTSGLTWFLTGLRHEAIRMAKKYRQLDERELLILDEPADPDLSEKASLLDTIAAAVDVAVAAEGYMLVQDALSLLTPLQRAVIAATVLGDATKEKPR